MSLIQTNARFSCPKEDYKLIGHSATGSGDQRRGWGASMGHLGPTWSLSFVGMGLLRVAGSATLHRCGLGLPISALTILCLSFEAHEIRISDAPPCMVRSPGRRWAPWIFFRLLAGPSIHRMLLQHLKSLPVHRHECTGNNFCAVGSNSNCKRPDLRWSCFSQRRLGRMVSTHVRSRVSGIPAASTQIRSLAAAYTRWRGGQDDTLGTPG
jgi:hypothetical protein